MSFESYHFHLYFEKEQVAMANTVIDKLREFDFLDIGRIWDRPVGPHPIGSCQVTVKKENFEFMSSWFLQKRGGLSVFVHALTGDDLKDHTDYVIWIGSEHQLNIDFFTKGNK